MDFHTRSFKLQVAKRMAMLSAVMMTVLCVCWFTIEPAAALYILTGEDESVLVLEEGADTADFSSKFVYVGSNASGFELTLTAGQSVKVLFRGAVISATSRQETISALLKRLNVVPGPLDMVAVDLSETGATLTVASDLTYYERVTERDAYETVYVNDPTLPEGVQELSQAGADGVRSAVYEVTYSGGERISRQLVQEEDSTAVDAVIRLGTSADEVATSDWITEVTKYDSGGGRLTFASGATLEFSDVKSMTATAYTSGHGGADNYTATGTTVRVGVVAVDRKVIPLGTRMYIVSADGSVTYGLAVAEDTGVRGNVVDLYYDTYEECIQFGRRAATVYILD